MEVGKGKESGERGSGGRETTAVGTEERRTLHSGSSHFHSVIFFSFELGFVLVGEGVYVIVGGGRTKEEGGEDGLSEMSVLFVVRQ